MGNKTSSTTIVISKKAFFSSILILFVLTLLAGILTQIIPTGHYQRVKTIDGENIIPSSFSYSNEKPLAVYHWFIAWLEVLFSEGNILVISIIVFILIIGTSFAVIDNTKVLHEIIDMLCRTFAKNRFTLVAIITLFFMLIGSMFGIFEEMLPLIPLAILLSKNFGWDELTGLGMSLLATGFGFAAAISNPFSIGVAQKLANLPVFSGFTFRLVVFAVIYLILLSFLLYHIKKNLKLKGDFNQQDTINPFDGLGENKKVDFTTKLSIIFFIVMMAVMLIFIILTLFIKEISEFSLPFIALIFIIISVGLSVIKKIKFSKVLKTAISGFTGIAPAIILILLAMGVNFIIRKGNIIDTILYFSSNLMQKTGSYSTALGIYAITLFLNFFIGSASAKAFLLMPILTPLSDITGITRQVAVLAFQFGDGFSNVIYPTNPVLLVGLAISAISYPKWFKFAIFLQIIILIVTSLFVCLAVAIGYR